MARAFERAHARLRCETDIKQASVTGPRGSAALLRPFAQPASWLPRLPDLEVVYGKLLHVRRVREPLIAHSLKAGHQPLADETVERLTRLPEIDHTPATV